MPGQRHPRKNKQHNIIRGGLQRLQTSLFQSHFFRSYIFMTDKERMDRIHARKSVLNPLVIILRAHFYTGIPRMCAHLRPKSRRVAAVGLRNASLRLGVRGRTPRTPECPGCFASLRSEQGTASLAPLCGYPCRLGQRKRFCKPFPLTKFLYHESDRQ